MAWKKAAVLGLVASPATVVAGVILGRLALAGGGAISVDLALGSLLLLATAWTPVMLLGAG